MPLRDYAHHNEDAKWMWWQEEGRHPYEPEDPADHDDRDYFEPDPIRTVDCEVCDYSHDVYSDDENFTCSNCGVLLDPEGAVVVTQPELSQEDS